MYLHTFQQIHMILSLFQLSFIPLFSLILVEVNRSATRKGATESIPLSVHCPGDCMELINFRKYAFIRSPLLLVYIKGWFFFLNLVSLSLCQSILLKNVRVNLGLLWRAGNHVIRKFTVTGQHLQHLGFLFDTASNVGGRMQCTLLSPCWLTEKVIKWMYAVFQLMRSRDAIVVRSADYLLF